MGLGRCWGVEGGIGWGDGVDIGENSGCFSGFGQRVCGAGHLPSGSNER